MGVRVTAFVVDAVEFAAIIERPLWQILSDTSQVQFDGDAIFGANDRATNTRYLIRADHGIARHRPGAGVVEVSPAELRSDPFLRQATREYVAQGSSYDLLFLLRTWSLLPKQTCVRTIGRGERSMWIDGVLEAAAAKHLLAPAEFAQLAGYLGRILRERHSRNFPRVRQEGPPLVPKTFPVVPADDADCWMGVFDDVDILGLADMLNRLMERGPTFPVPKYLGPYANAEEWPGYVREMVDRFRRVPELDLPNLHLVTFIG